MVPLIPVPPLTMSAPLLMAVEAVELLMVVTPEILVVLSVELLVTDKLLKVLVAAPDEVIPFVKVASPRMVPLPLISKLPPT